jgi:hypothetical protein
MHRWFGIQIAQAPEPQTAENSGDVAEMQTLVAEVDGSLLLLLLLLLIEHLPLSAARAASIRQRGCTT